MANYIIAIDGGGTKTRVISTTAQGLLVKSAVVGPIGLTSTSLGAAVFNLKEGIRQVCDGFKKEDKIINLTIGLAGLDTTTEEQEVEKIFKGIFQELKIENYLIINDAYIALENGTQKQDALVLVSGTGSNCLGRNSQGKMAKAGGLDYILSDEGSGYSIGLSCLKTAVKSSDGRIEKSLIEDMVKKHFNATSILDLKTMVYNPNLTKVEVAGLAPICFKAFRTGDDEAKRILNDVIDELALLAKAVLKKLNLIDKPADCILAGGINQDQYIYQNIAQKIQAINPQINVIIPQTQPVYGALKIALKNIYGNKMIETTETGI
jgi:N-acetylglucosamine kinase-like BadF-type ATPase